MPRFRADLVFYFDADDRRTVPRRLQELNAAAAAVGFEFHGGQAAEGSEPEPPEDGCTRYAPMPDPPA
jgi:hypothetical protein